MNQDAEHLDLLVRPSVKTLFEESVADPFGR